jgi:hypothetical protein
MKNPPWGFWATAGEDERARQTGFGDGGDCWS